MGRLGEFVGWLDVLACLGAIAALVWLMLYAWSTLANGMLGVAVLAILFVFMVITIGIAGDEIRTGKDRQEE